MKYVNGLQVLPEELLNEIRKYAEGVYVYIPKSNSKKSKWGEETNFGREMELRNLQIYDKYLEGHNAEAISDFYHLSIKSIKRIILSQKRAMEPMKFMIREILKGWNLEYLPVQIYHSAWSVNDSYVLKVYDNSNTLQRNILMMKKLHESGIPVPEIIKLPNNQDYLLHDEKMYMLTTKLSGTNIVDIIKCNDEWFYEFGKILARLHIAFKEIEKNISYWNNNLLEEMNGWVNGNLQKFHPEYLKQEDINTTIDELMQVSDKLPNQLIHRDVHLGNFLFKHGVFSGYIDFDLSQSNIRIFDLCYFLLGILLDKNNHIDEDKWYEIIQHVIKGYDSILALNPYEKGAIACVMKNIELLFTAYFLGVGDENSAKDSANLFLFIKKNEDKINAVMKML